MPPVPTEYERALDDEGINWMRIRFSKFRGRIVSFAVQCETTIDGTRMPIVRFDTAHGRAHRDMMYQNGRQLKLWLDEGLSYNDALRLAEDDINSNWERYREAFYRGHP